MAAPTLGESRTQHVARTFSESVRHVASTLSTSEVVTRLCDRARELIDVQVASVLMSEPSGALRIACAHGIASEVVEHMRMQIDEGISGYVARTRAALWIEDIERDTRFARPNAARYTTPSLISVPIVASDRLRGVLNVNNRRDGKPLTLDDLALLADLAGHAAVALANAEQYEALLHRAQHDGLTGLANRNHLWSVFEGEIARARRYARICSVMMLDVDHFKRFNDVRGHLAGDRALERVAAVIRRLCRASDTAGRYGGEEFLVILPETPLDGAVRLARKIRRALEREDWGSANPPLTVSAGVAEFPIHGYTAKQLLHAADRQLYRAKASGRNRVCSPSDAALA